VRHRIVGLANDGLKRSKAPVPVPIAQAIAGAAAEQLRQNLTFAAEVVRLQRAFRAKEVPVTFFKGVPTALDIYGDLAIRHSKDIDLLIVRDAISRADVVLREVGYSRVDPPPTLDKARIRTLVSLSKDFTYAHGQNESLEVELHWR